MTEKEPQMLTSEQAAEMLGVTVSRVDKLAKEGRFKGARKLGRDWRIPRKAVEEHKATRKTGRPARTEQPIT